MNRSFRLGPRHCSNGEKIMPQFPAWAETLLERRKNYAAVSGLGRDTARTEKPEYDIILLFFLPLINQDSK
jgi:hypothetical protein